MEKIFKNISGIIMTLFKKIPLVQHQKLLRSLLTIGIQETCNFVFIRAIFKNKNTVEVNQDII